MPLPAALLAKLQKRGLVNSEWPWTSDRASEQQEEEEVFAENYDDSDAEDEDADETAERRPRGGAFGCPNKWNQFHLCSDFCFDHWQEGLPESRLSEEYLRAKQTMLTKFPLPEGWEEVYDAGVARHYYWRPETDEVCWLSPAHPSAVISQAAQKLAQDFYNSKQEEKAPEKPAGREAAKRDGGRFSRWERGKRFRREERPGASGQEAVEPDSIEDMPERDRLKRARRKGLDPMDPSAYSDCAEGGWGAGITSEAKTGVDATASGPLFQSRPYPAPGAVLRKNQPKS